MRSRRAQRIVDEGNSILRGGREPRVEEPKVKRPIEELVIESALRHRSNREVTSVP